MNNRIEKISLLNNLLGLVQTLRVSKVSLSVFTRSAPRMKREDAYLKKWQSRPKGGAPKDRKSYPWIRSFLIYPP